MLLYYKAFVLFKILCLLLIIFWNLQVLSPISTNTYIHLFLIIKIPYVSLPASASLYLFLLFSFRVYHLTVPKFLRSLPLSFRTCYIEIHCGVRRRKHHKFVNSREAEEKEDESRPLRDFVERPRG